jgi:hypothetical protein
MQKVDLPQQQVILLGTQVAACTPCQGSLGPQSPLMLPLQPC